MSMLTATAPPATLRLSGDGRGVGDARRAAADLLARAGSGWVDGDAVLLTVSELVTNAVRHGGGVWNLRLHADASDVRLEVRDRGRGMPRPRLPDMEHGTGGFGWHMVHELADRIEVVRLPWRGKAVRATWWRRA
ncbi:ATP-binding protein [Streptomyces sp. NPDC059506]|uniref:ATP-binding protein n=1 Tax=Streptomyces TaxID=1883 RepID=UPI0015F8DAF8|nr:MULTISPECIES: ATP-binding protein [unclassified Streptomyces]MCZ2523505.1 ATP-binding protein [Streptomyces sp. HB2AG]QMV20579.1 ATP-binding protein [Streptomyces sp. SCUT-3]